MKASSFSPARLLTDLNYAAKIWFGLFLLMGFSQALTLILLLRPSTMEAGKISFVTSDGTPLGAVLTPLVSLTNLHVRAAEDATLLLLNRNPAGFDFPDRISWLYLPEAAAQALTECEQERPDRQLRQLRQKPEIARIHYLSVSDNRIMVSVSGQVIQMGAFNGRPLAQAVPFQLDLDLVPNPNLAMNGVFPLVVRRYLYESPPR